MKHVAFCFALLAALACAACAGGGQDGSGVTVRTGGSMDISGGASGSR